MENKNKNKKLTLLITISLLLAIMAILPSVSAASATGYDVSPGYISTSSSATALIKLVTSTSLPIDYLKKVNLSFSGSGFATSDLYTLANNDTSGVSLYLDDGDSTWEGSPNDVRISLLTDPVWNGNTLSLQPPSGLQLGQILYVVIRTSATISDADVINVTVTGMQNYSNHAITISGTLSAEIITDLYDPTVPGNAVTAPNGGEQWSGTKTITWNNTDITDSHFNSTPILLYYSNNGGTSWTQIGTWTANDGSYSWDTTTAGGDGSNYKINITATDNASNTGYDVSNATFTVDNAAPTCTIEYNLSSTYFAAGTAIKIYANFTEALSGMDNSTVVISISTPGNGDLTEIAMSQTNITNYYYNWSIPSGSDDDGAFTVMVNGSDNASNSVSETDNSKMIDNTGATAVISVPINGTWYGSLATISGTCSDGGSGVGSVNITIYNQTSGKYWNFSGTPGWDTGVNWTSTTVVGGATWSKDVSSVTWSNGTTYTINATATDNVSNVGTKVWNTFSYDDNDVTSSVTQIDPYWRTSPPLSIAWTASDSGSGLNNVVLYYRYSADNVSWDDWITFGLADTTPWDPTPWSFTFTNGSGFYEFYTIATDNVSNTEVKTTNDTICGYDPDAPTGTITLPINNEFYKAGTGIDTNITGTATDVRGVTNVYVEIYNRTDDTYFNGTNWQASYINLSANLSGGSPATNWWYENTSAFPTWSTGKSYYVNISALDTAGNWNSSAASSTFLYDTNNPTVTISLPVDGTWYNSFSNITGTASDTGGSGIQTINITIYNQTGDKYWTGSAWGVSTNLAATGTLSWYYDTLPTWTNGTTYIINATATDYAENIGSTDSNTFYYDDNDLVSQVTAISTYWQTTSPLSIAFTASDVGSGLHNVTLYYRYSSDNATWGSWTTFGTADSTPWDPTAWSFTFPGGAGYYEFYTIATDNASNSEVKVSADTICGYDDTNPTVTISIPANNEYYTSMNTISGTCIDTGYSGINRVNFTIYNATGGTYWNGATWAAGVNWTTTTLNAGATSWSSDTSSVTWEDAADYTINATAVDNATRTSTVDSNSFTIDTTAPTVTIAFDNSDTYYSDADAVIIYANFTETGSGINESTVTITVKNSTGSTIASGATRTDNTHWYYTWNVPAGNDGNVNVTVSAQDNVSQSLSGITYDTSKYIDNTNPTVTIEFNNTANYYRDANVVRIFANLTETGSGIDETTVKITIVNISSGSALNDSEAMTRTSNTNWYFDWDVPSDQNCNVNISIEATDNVSLAISGVNYSTVKYVDNIDPTGTITIPANSGYYDESLTNISGSASDSGLGASGVVAVTITIYNATGGTYFDGSAWGATVTNLSANTSGTGLSITWWYEDTGAFPTWTDGSNYTINLTVTDTAGNTNIGVDSNTFHYDSGGPTISSVLITDVTIGSTTYVKNGDTVNITANVTDANLQSGDVSYIKADLTGFGLGAAVAADGYDGTTAYWNQTIIACTPGNGTITVTINASDQAGNYATEVNDTITADNAVPTISYVVLDADNDGNTQTYVDVYFSESTMDTSTYNAADFTISDVNVTVSSTQNATTSKVTLKLSGLLPTGNSPTVTIAGSITDQAGNAIVISSSSTIYSFRISLRAGWNLVSIPGYVNNVAIATLLSGISANVNTTFSYNPSSGWTSWSPGGGGDLTTLQAGKGYWIKMNSADVLTGNYNLYYGEPPAFPTQTLTGPGWNLIGHYKTYNQTSNTNGALKSLNSILSSTGEILYKYTTSGGFTNIYDDSNYNMEPGVGYWLWISDTTTNAGYAPS